MANLKVAFFFVAATTAGLIANTEHPIDSATVVLTPQSVVKSPMVITTVQGDITIVPSNKTIYVVTYQIGHGPIQNIPVPGNMLLTKVKQMEFIAHEKKFTFTVLNIEKKQARR